MLRVGAIALLCSCVFGCENGTMVLDAGGVDAIVPCTTASDCDDGAFCNGPEICAPGADGTDARGCLLGTDPCDGAACDEDADECGCADPDQDGDGRRASTCGGDDCDDADPNRYPGNPEVCDELNHDEDCRSSTYGYVDLDGDGYVDATCCNVDDAGALGCGDDCNDMRAGSNPAVPEVCNDVDDDCDGFTDEGVLVTYTIDVDGDGYGSDRDGAMQVITCVRPIGFAATADDCDDDVAGVNPSAVELCDEAMEDEDCNGLPNDVLGGCTCLDPSSRVCPGLMGRCAGATQNCTPEGTWQSCSIEPIDEVCNSLDDDCDGATDEGQTVTCYPDADNDGYARFGTTAVELCPNAARPEPPFNRCPVFFTGRVPMSDAVESDCDDGNSAQAASVACYPDSDRDTYGASSAAATYACPGACPAGRVPNRRDCCDGDARANPGATSFFVGYPTGCLLADWDCNGVEERRYGAVDCRRLFPSSPSCSLFAAGYSGGVPSCNNAGNLDDLCMTSPSGACYTGGGPTGITVQPCR